MLIATYANKYIYYFYKNNIKFLIKISDYFLSSFF